MMPPFGVGSVRDDSDCGAGNGDFPCVLMYGLGTEDRVEPPAPIVW